jgi:hypothetical protein
MQANLEICLDTMLTLQQLLLEYNPFVPFMKQAYEILCEEREQGNEHLDLVMHPHFQLKRDVRCYNLSHTNEITIVLPRDGEVPNAFCDIVIHLRGGAIQHINECHPSYLSLHTVLFFSFGELRWYLNIISHVIILHDKHL